MPPDNVSDLLVYATTNYGNHTEWFLRHKESGFRTLGAVLSAELAIAGFYFSHAHIARGVAVGALLLLGVLSIPLTRLAIRSCSKAFQASLEHAFMITKVVCAMGLGEGTRLALDHPQSSALIGPGDATLYVPRYLEHASQAQTTADFVERGFARGGTTYSSTLWTLRIVGSVAAAVGIGGSIAAWFVP